MKSLKYIKAQIQSILDSMKLSNKRGQMNMNSVVYAVIGILLVVVLVVSVAPTAFDGSNNVTGAPTWFNTVFPIIIAAAFILLVWRAISAR